MPDTTLTRAHALIAAAEKERLARFTVEIGRPVPLDISDYWRLAANDAPDIARALVAVMERLRTLADRAEADMKYNMDEETPGWWSTRTAEAIADARAFLAQHGGERNEPLPPPANLGE